MKNLNFLKNVFKSSISISVLFIMILLISTKAYSGSKSNSDVAKIHHKNVPAWVINPQDSKDNPEVSSYKFCAVGSAPDTGEPSNQVRIAKINAQSEASRIMNVEVNDNLEVKEKVSGSYDNAKKESTVSSSTLQSSNSFINKYTEVNRHYDKKTNTLYIRLCF